MKKLLVILVLLLGASLAWGQLPPITGMGDGQVAPPQGAVDLDENGNPITEKNADSVKKAKPRKPLLSYFFDDSTKKNRFFSWTPDLLRNHIVPRTIDTAAHSMQPHHPLLNEGRRGVAWQGNMGGAAMPLAYDERANYRDFTFAQGFDAYNIFPERAAYYNVKNPLTFFSYYMSGQSKRFEEGFYLTHAQNISPSSGFNVDYRSQGTRGYYNWSKGRDKNLSLAFSHTGRKYSAHGGYIYNTANNKENGGVVNDRYITDTLFELAEAVPVKLTDARNVIKGNTLYLVQSYGWPAMKMADSTTMAEYPSFYIGHSIQWARWKKLYTDSRAATKYNQLVPGGGWDNVVEEEFYKDWFFDPNYTTDSLSETMLANRAFVQIQPYSRNGIIGLIDAGAGIDQHSYYQFRPDDYISGRRSTDNQTDIYVDGAINGRVRRYFNWQADGKLHPMGDRRGDFDIGGTAALSIFPKGREVTLSGSIRTERRSPDYWVKNMVSNHFAWHNDFSAENETRLRGELRVPSWALEMGLSQSVIDKKIYYGADARPAQSGSAVSVTAAWVDKDFRFGGWSLRHRVTVQRSSNAAAVPVPLATAWVSYSYTFNVVRNVLRATVGLDGYYNTKYYAPGWMPATAQFYNQREKQLGEYPLVDAYVAAKWKRMRLLLKMEHVNENLFGSRSYFTLLHYPQAKRVFKFGFTWAFYD